MTQTVIRKQTNTPLVALGINASRTGPSKSVLCLAKTAIDSLGRCMQSSGGAVVASLGGRACNLGGLFGAMAGGYALNDCGESASAAIGGALALRREVNAQNMLGFLGGLSLAASDGLGAVGFIASRGALALGGAAVLVEMLSLATLALGAAITAVRTYLALREVKSQIGEGGATAEQAAQIRQLHGLLARMGMLCAVGLLGLASTAALPAAAVGMASAALMTSFFATDLFMRISGRTDPQPKETVDSRTVVVDRNDPKVGQIWQDRFSAEDAALKENDPTQFARVSTMARQELAAASGEAYFAGIPGTKGVQGFIRGFGEAAALTAGALGHEDVAATISDKAGRVAGGLMPQAEAVTNGAALVKAIKKKDKAVEIAKCSGKVINDAAKITSLFAKFKVISLAKEVLKPIDLIGKAADLGQALLTVISGKSLAQAPGSHPGKDEINSAVAKVNAWNKTRELAKLALTVLALTNPILGAFGRSAPTLVLRGLTMGAGLTMGVAATAAHFIAGTSRYEIKPQSVDILPNEQN